MKYRYLASWLVVDLIWNAFIALLSFASTLPSIPDAYRAFAIKPTNSLMAVVSQNQTVSENTTVGLSGAGIDPDQNAKLSYLWKQIDGGPSVKLTECLHFHT